MHVIKVGLNYRVAPLEVREKVTFSSNEIKKATRLLNEKYTILENVIISTCNRTEIFAVVEQVDDGIISLQQFMKDWFQLQESEFVNYFQNSMDDDAIRHLFTLAVGLDSMVIGETQILGQIRSAFLTAQEMNATGRLLNELFKRVITFAKRSHNETGIGEHAVSISYVAVELCKEIFGSIQDTRAVVLGAGEMGALTVKNLQAAGVEKITVINRTYARAVNLAEELHVEALPMEQLINVLKDADLFISSTGSSEVILDKTSLQVLREKPLTIVDIAVPRDIDPSVKELGNIVLYDVDDLQGVVDENIHMREEAAAIIKSEVATEVCAFNEWVAMLDTVPLIKALHKKSNQIQKTTLQSIHRKMPDLSERERRVLEKHTSSIIHQLLRDPLETVKDMGKHQQPERDLQLFKHIFGLEVRE